MKPDTKVIMAADADVPEPGVGTVVDHVPAELTPPDDGVVLVRWSRSMLSWEYTQDLAVWEG